MSDKLFLLKRMKNMKILIWGTGNTAKTVMERGINGELVGFMRSGMCAEEGQMSLYGVPVYTPETIDVEYDVIFVASIYSDEIYQTIQKSGIPLEKVCFWQLPTGGEVNTKDNLEKASQFLSQENLLWISKEKRGTSITDDGTYPAFCQKAAKEDALFNRFRSHPIYKVVLEHTSYQLGKQYLEIIHKNHQVHFNEQDWADFSKNDLYGGAELYSFKMNERPFEISPSTLRYVKVLQDIFTLFDTDRIKTIAEIGVGYGGQCRLLTSQLKNLRSYALIDLPEILPLAERYLEHFENREKLQFVDGTTDMNLAEAYDFAISNYAFSELTREVQDHYLEKVLLKTRYGYITWNELSHQKLDGYRVEEIVERLPGKPEVIAEKPLTFEGNCIIIWGRK